MQGERITAIIVDDEADAREALEILLEDIPKIEIINQFEAAQPAIDFIVSTQPDIIFLDIDMPGKNGFEFIAELKDLHLSPNIIFTTAHSEYAIEAIEEAAFGHLLKPIDPDKLRKVVNRYVCENTNQTESGSSKRLKFNTRCGFIVIDPVEIVFCSAHNNYSEIHSLSSNPVTVSQNLGQLEKKLGENYFFRISRSSIINVNFLKKVIRKEKICVLSCNSIEVKLKVAETKIKKLDELFR